MIKFERTDERVHVEAGGELVEILADITVLLKVLYEHMEGEQKEEFRFVMSHALAEDDFPAWDGKPLPGQSKTKIAPGVEDLLKELARKRDLLKKEPKADPDLELMTRDAARAAMEKKWEAEKDARNP